MYDASDRKSIRRAEKAARQDEIARIEYLRAAMSTWQGRAWFYDLLAFCHCWADPFTGDALAEAYRKGERNVGLRIFADIIAHCPDEYIQMTREENGRRIERDILAARSAPAEHSGSPDPDGGVEGPDLDNFIGAEDE